MKTPLLSVKNLVRHFGAVRAVDGISFELIAGQSVGLIGANGAGKTTTLRMLTGLDLPDSGEITLQGVDMLAEPEKVRALIGWMPDAVDAWPSTTVRDYLDFFARAYGLKGEYRVSEVDRLLEFCGITSLSKRRINKLSKGQSQRLSLARTLVGDPQLLLLDEPAAGLDPLARAEFKQLVRSLQEQGKTIVISSHILSELAEMCDSVIMMDDGKIIRQGADDDVLVAKELGCRLRLRPLGEAAELMLLLQNREHWSELKVLEGGLIEALFSPKAEEGAEISPEAAAEAQAKELAALCPLCPLLEFYEHRLSLEEGFISLLQGKKKS